MRSSCSRWRTRGALAGCVIASGLLAASACTGVTTSPGSGGPGPGGDGGPSGSPDSGTNGPTDAGAGGAKDAGTNGSRDAGTQGTPDAGSGSPMDAGTTTSTGSALTPQQAQAMVDAHNQVRANVSPAPSTPLPPLTWDSTLAAYAQWWADTDGAMGCPLQHSMNGNGPYGENIYWIGGAQATPQQVVDAWNSESAMYDYATNSCNGSTVPDQWIACGHYTQLVWDTTLRVGCGVAACSSGSKYDWVWVCDYDPPGNFCSQTSCQRPYN